MVKFLIGLVTGVALVFLSLILLFVVALRFRESAPAIADNSVLVLRLTGELPEKPPMELPSFLGPRRYLLRRTASHIPMRSIRLARARAPHGTLCWARISS